MRYVLLLRGINVGGKSKVVMAELREQLESLGFEKVKSYINSGNLFFNTDVEPEKIDEKIAGLLTRYYDFDLPFVVISETDYEQDYANLPDWWEDNLARKDVLFYTNPADRKMIEEAIQAMPLQDEKVHFGNLAVYWGKVDETTYLKTSYAKYLAKAPYYKKVTIRNGNTYAKIYQLLKA